MGRTDKNIILMTGLLAVAALLSLCLYFADFKQNDTVQIKDFPRQIDGWTSQEIPMTRQDIAILETDNTFIRKYTSPQGESVYLYIVYSQTNHKVSHPPEICYTGSGISILENVHDRIPVSYRDMRIKTNRLLLQSGALQQVSFYWFKVGDSFTSNYWKEQMLIAVDTLLCQRKGSALIRISADIVNHDKQKAIKEIDDFANLITPALFKYLP